MAATATQRLRIAGLVFLGIALVLAILGQTVLRPRLDGLVFLFYWITCLVALGLAVAIALLDILLVRHEARREQIELLRQTLERTSAGNSTSAKQVSSSTEASTPIHTKHHARSGAGASGS
jgi:hypothetical protein